MSSPSTSRKRGRDGEADSALQNCSVFNPSSSFEDTLTFSDTLVALRMMRAQFPAMDKLATEIVKYDINDMAAGWMRECLICGREQTSAALERCIRGW